MFNATYLIVSLYNLIFNNDHVYQLASKITESLTIDSCESILAAQAPHLTRMVLSQKSPIFPTGRPKIEKVSGSEGDICPVPGNWWPWVSGMA